MEISKDSSLALSRNTTIYTHSLYSLTISFFKTWAHFVRLWPFLYVNNHYWKECLLSLFFWQVVRRAKNSNYLVCDAQTRGRQD